MCYKFKYINRILFNKIFRAFLIPFDIIKNKQTIIITCYSRKYLPRPGKIIDSPTSPATSVADHFFICIAQSFT